MLNKHIEQHKSQIEILSESTKQNLIKRQTMKEQLFENYNKITKIRSSIHDRIVSDDVKEHLLLVIKYSFLESQNIQLLLNLQLQAKTIAKYDKYLTNISLNGGVYIESSDVMEEGEINEEEEEEDELSDIDQEEEKIDNILDVKPMGDEKSASPDRSGIQTEGKQFGSKLPKVKAPIVNKKSTLMNHPYFKKNPYLVQQSKNKKKFK